MRRRPQQARAAMRRAKFLEVAGRLIGEVGFDVVTMTAVAEEAGASIGTLYDYFPDKQALALALMQQYAEETDEHWRRLLEDAAGLGEAALADLFVEGALEFARSRPGYLGLFGVPYRRSAEERQPLRRTFAEALRRLNPAMTEERAFLSAQVVVELIKGMLAVCKQVEGKDRDSVTAEFKQLMRFYLSDGCGEG